MMMGENKRQKHLQNYSVRVYERCEETYILKFGYRRRTGVVDEDLYDGCMLANVDGKVSEME